MPTYEFRCPNGHTFDQFHKISDAPQAAACPTCGAEAARAISGGAGLVFKGSGFYLTDYGKNAHRTSGPPASGGGEGKGESKGEGKADTAKGDAPKADAPAVGGSKAAGTEAKPSGGGSGGAGGGSSSASRGSSSTGGGSSSGGAAA